MFSIREGTVDDIPSLAGHRVGMFRSSVPMLPRPDGSALELGPEAIVLNVYVEREWRRRGIAEALMGELLQALAERGIGRIVLHASEEGRGLYRRLGFTPTNEMRLLAEK